MKSKIETKIKNFTLRFATKKDTEIILNFINGLAQYENLSNEVTATKDILEEFLFEKKMAEVVIGEFNGEPVGFVLFFHNFSTFLGRPGIYLEDLYVKPEMRGKGFGKMLLSFLAKLAIERKCGRFEWSCLNWNEPSIKFYKQMGAKAMNEWTIYRTCDEALKNLASQF